VEIDWFDNGILHTHSFTALFVGQCDQWYMALQRLVPPAESVPFLDPSHLISDVSMLSGKYLYDMFAS